MSSGLASPAALSRKLLAALYPREKWTPAQWAENCRVLGEDESSEPGPYRFDRTPYWRFVADLIALAGVEEIVLLKGAQIGWSEICRNLLGYWIDLDPGPTLILAPDELSAENFSIERLEPLIKNTPAVARHVTDRSRDQSKTRKRFDTMSIFLAWSGSKSGTKSRPIRYLIAEEPDEFAEFSGSGGDPLSKAYKRLTTYADKGRARALIGGTPTHRLANVSKRWEACAVRYHPWLPCPHCNGFQRLEWKQVKWAKLDDIAGGESLDRAHHAELIESQNLAWYECEHCHGKILDHHKPRMLLRLVWATEDQAVTRDGRVVGPDVRAKRVGVKISGLYSPWVKFATLAREWIEAQGDPDALADFINQRLAETFEEERQKTEPTFIAEKAKNGPPPLVIPRWAVALIASADTQGTDERDGYFYYTIRAWGYGYRSQLIDYGVCHSKGELKATCLERRLPIEKQHEYEQQEFATPQMLLIDSGGPRFQEIYELAQADARIHPTKGESHNRVFLLDERMQKRHNVVLWMINTEQSKDLLHRLIHDPDRTRWLPHSAINEDYCRQMTAESKVWDPTSRKEVWTEIVKNNNHFWDCEHQQCAAAWKMGCGAPPPEPEPPATPAKTERPDWMPERPANWVSR